MPPKRIKKQKVDSAENDESFCVAQALTILTSGDLNELTMQQKVLWLTSIENVSQQCGLSEEELIALVDVIGNQIFNSSVSKRLISYLIPSNYVPADAVIKAISWMTLKMFPSSLQVCFTKWMNSIYKRLSNKENLSYLYALLFEFLKSDSVCPHMCELLCKITKKEHVTSYNMKRLLEIELKMGSQPYILTLVKLYVDLRPDLLCLVSSKTKNTLKFFDTLAQIEPSSKDANSSSSSVQDLNFQSDLSGYNNMCKEIENLKSNSGVIKLYNSPMRRQLLMSNLSEDLLCAFELFLKSGLLAGGNMQSRIMVPYSSKDELLEVLSELTSELQEGIPVVLTFIASYLKIWDGYANREAILNLIEHWELCNYEELWESVLQPLYKLFYCGDIDFMCSVIQCLTNLYRFWAIFELPRYFERTVMQSTMLVPYKTTSIFHKDFEIENPENQIEALSVFIDKLCVTALLRYPKNQILILHSALRLYETVLTVNEKNRSLFLLVPSSPVMAALMFSRNPLHLSSICGLICRYRDSIYEMKESEIKSNFIASSLNLVNKYVLDLCNMLGLCSAFKFKDDSVFFQSNLPDHVNMSCTDIHEAFSIYRHPAMLGLVLRFRKERMKNIAPQMLLKANAVRNDFFQYLSSAGFSGIPLFLRTFIKSMAESV